MSGLRASARVEGSHDRWKRTYLHAHEHGCWCTQVLRAAGRDPVPHWRSSGGHVSLSPGPLTTRQLAALRSRKQGSGRDRDAGQRLCTIKSQKWHPLTFPRSGSSLGSPTPRAASSTEGWPPGGRGPGGQLGGHPYAAEYHTTSKQKRISCPAVSGSGTPWTAALQAPLSMELECKLQGKSIGVSGHSLLHGIFLTQESNSDLSHCRRIIYLLSHQGRPIRRKVEFKAVCTFINLALNSKLSPGLKIPPQFPAHNLGWSTSLGALAPHHLTKPPLASHLQQRQERLLEKSFLGF